MSAARYNADELRMPSGFDRIRQDIVAAEFRARAIMEERVIGAFVISGAMPRDLHLVYQFGQPMRVT